MSIRNGSQHICKTCKGSLELMKSTAKFCSDKCRRTAHRRKAQRGTLRARARKLKRLQERWNTYLKAVEEHQKDRIALQEHLSDPSNPLTRVTNPEFAAMDINIKAGVLKSRLRLLEGDIIRSGFKADEVKKAD